MSLVIPDSLQIIILGFLSGSTTLIGILLAFIIKENKISNSIGLGFSSGIMIGISFLELLTTALTMANRLSIIFTFTLGFVAILVIDILLPHMHFIKEKGEISHLVKASYIVAIGMLIHDFPEGFALATSFTVDKRLGILVALGIALHNIPEEFALALPLVITNEKRLLLKLGALSALAEPLGAIIGVILITFISQLTPFFLAFAAGVMVFIAVDELQPLAFEYGGIHHFALGFIGGITTFMILSTYL
jgi:ZIP family zinc transporter